MMKVTALLVPSESGFLRLIMGQKKKSESFLTTYLIANTAVDTEKRNFRKNDTFFAHGEKIVFWAFFTSERNEMKPFPTVSDAQLY